MKRRSWSSFKKRQAQAATLHEYFATTFTNTFYCRLKPKRPLRSLDDSASKISRGSANWVISETENAEPVEIANEDKEALVVTVASMATSNADDRGPHPVATEAGTDTVNPHLAVTLILTSRLARTKAATLAPLLDLAPLILLLAGNRVMLVVPGLQAAAEPTADPSPPTRADAKEPGAAQTTVIDADPLTKIIHAHQFPEMNQDTARSPAA